MHIAQPSWILIGILGIIGLLFFLKDTDKKKQQKLEQFAARNLLSGLLTSVSSKKILIKRVFLLLAVFFCFFAMARPQVGYHWIDVKRKGIDILFAIDTSSSMLAEDIHPNRLERSKFAIIDFIKQLEGDRVGLMPFAGSSYLMCPLTVDYNAFEETLRELDTNIIPTPGTDIAQAIDEAEKVLHNDANHKLLIIITDGENLEGDVEQATLIAASKNMTIFTVGVGTTAGELIPITTDGQQGFVRDAEGSFVRSRLDEKTLEQIAKQTGGIYAPLGTHGQGLQEIYQKKLSLIPKEDIAERRKKVPIDRFSWFLGVALIFFVLEFITSIRKKDGPFFSFTKKAGVHKIILLFVCISAMAWPHIVEASTGEEAYANEEYIKAQEYYAELLEKDPKNTMLLYNHATAAYKNNLMDEAIAGLQKSLQSDDLGLQEKAYFNLGNAYFKRGSEKKATSPNDTIKEWQQSIASFDSVLQLSPENVKAQENKKIVQEELKKLKEQQQNQENQQEKNQQDQNRQANKESQEGSEKDKNDADADRQESQQQKKGAREEKKNPEEKPAPENGDAEKQDEKNGQNQSGQLLERKAGELTKEEAEQLLDEMGNHEGMLNFLPQQQPQQNHSRRTW